MKFKRILAVILSALMLTSMASFTVSAQEEALADLRATLATDNGLFTGNVDFTSAEKENNITWQGVENVTKLDPIRTDDDANVETSKGDTTYFPAEKSFVVEGYGHVPTNSSTGKEQKFVDFGKYRYVLVKYYYAHELPDGTAPTGAKMEYRVMNSQLADNGYTNVGNMLSDELLYNQWDWAVFDVHTATNYNADAKIGAFQYHLYPMGDIKSKDAQPTEVMYLAAVQYSADLKADVTYVNNGVALKSGASLPATASVDFFTEGYALDTAVLESAEEGWAFKGWSLTENGDVISTVDVDASDITVYAVWEYSEPEGDFDEIYLQNVYHKLAIDKSLTIGYLGGSVTVGSGLANADQNTLSWRALTRDWFKTNFPDAAITEVYAAIGGTGSRFASYRATRDLKLDDPNVSIDLLFVDSCVNDKYEGFGAANAAELRENDAVIVAKVLENNPYCQVIFVGVPDVSTVGEGASYPTRDIHKAFAEDNGFMFLDFAVPLRAAMAEQEKEFYDFMGVTGSGDPDIVHPNASGYKVYADYVIEEAFAELVDDSLTLSKATYTETEFDTTGIDTMRYSGGSANSLSGLTTIKNWTKGQLNGFIGGNTVSASKEGYSTTFKFTGTNAYIWSNKHSHNALLDVYLNDNVTVGSPDYTIDMWRNQESGQSYMFPVLPEDLDEAAETKVTLVLRQNADQNTRNEADTKANVGTRLRNSIGNISVKGGTMDSVEFLDTPDAFKTTVEYSDIVVPASGLNLKIDQTDMVFESTELDGKEVTKTTYNGSNTDATFAIDGYHIPNYGQVLGEYYNFATIYMYVDDPEYKTQGLKSEILLREADQPGLFPNNIYTADTAIVPNAWQRISIDISAMENDNPAPLDALNQFHFRYFGSSTPATSFDGVAVYAEKLVFSATDPGDYADLDARVTNIKVNDESLEGFNINTFEYNVVLPFGTTEIPVVTAEKSIDEAAVTVVQPEAVDGTATVTLEGETDEDDVVYTINFTVFDGIKLNGFTVGSTDVVIEDGKTEYQITLPTGTTEVPEVVANFEGDPAKITVTQATALDGAAAIELEDGTVYTITFYVIPSLEDTYEGAKIVYVSKNGAGTADGTSVENAYKGLINAINSEAATTGRVVFAVIDDVVEVGGGTVEMNFPLDTVITSAGGDIYFQSHIKFKTNKKGKILIENVDIYHTIIIPSVIDENNKPNINAEVYLVAQGNDLTMRNVNVYPYGEFDGKKRNVRMYVQPGGDGGTFTKTEATKLDVYGVTGITVRGGGYGGSKFAGGIDYVIGGNSDVDIVYGAGHALAAGLVDNAAARTINGDITITVKDNPNIGSIYAGNAGITNGRMFYNIEGGTIGHLILGTNSSIADVTGYIVANITGGTVNKISKGQLKTEKARIAVIDRDNATVADDVSGLTHIVNYTGDGTVTVEADENDTFTIKLESDTAQWAAVTTPDGVTKKYDMATDKEVSLAHDMTIALLAGTTTVVFDAGSTVTFKALEADGAIADSTNVVTGLAGTVIPTPEAIEVKNEHFEFVGWALEGTTDIVTDFGSFTDDSVTYVAIFKEAPAVQFKANVEDGAVEALDTTIYGTTGADVAAPEAPAAKEHFTFKGWALEGTTDIVTDFGTFADAKAVYVAIYEEEPKFTITVMDGAEKVAEVTDYTGFTYTFEALAHTPTTRFRGYAEAADATEATMLAGNTVTVTANVTYYAVRDAIKLEDAEYTFAGEYDYSEGKYVVEMYYVGPKANMTAFGLLFPEYYTNRVVEYSDELQSTGTNKINGENYYVDVVYPTEGSTFGDDMKTPVLVATITGDMTPEIYAEQIVNATVIELITPYTASEQITGAFQGDSWQYIKNSDDFDLDIASHVHPIYFTNVVDDRDITVTVDGADADITTVVAPTAGKTLEAITFTAETAEGEEPAIVSYYVDGVAMGVLEAGDDGITYTVPAQSVLGDVTIEFSYGEAIPEVAITGINAPEVGDDPDTTARIPSGVNYTLDGVEWTPDDEEFDFDTAYTVKVTVTADEGYAFTGKTVYTINGETATVKKVDRDTVEVSYTFEPTVKELGTVKVTAGLVRDADDRAYANFGTISIIDTNGATVASYTETAEDEELAAVFDVLAGDYTVMIRKNGYITYEAQISVVYNKQTTVKTELVAGNLYEQSLDDGVIDLLDFARLTKAFTSETKETDADALAAYRAIVDIDEDGVVTVFDLAHIKANIGAQAE